MRSALTALLVTVAAAPSVIRAQGAPPAPAGLDACTYEACMPRFGGVPLRLVVGHPDSARALPRAEGDSLLRLTRGNDVVLAHRDARERTAHRRQLVGLGVLLVAAGGSAWAFAAGDDATAAVLGFGGAAAGMVLGLTASAPARDARAAWDDVVARHRDTLAAHLLARRGRGLADAASTLPTLAGCSWTRCRLAVRPGFLSDRLSVGDSEQELGFGGDALVGHVTTVPAAIPHAKRYASARRVARALGVATLLTTFAVGARSDSWFLVGSLATAAGATVFDLRARRAAEEATWLYNRELLR